tara:strand:- start:1800 stop:2150 length:351 start_codon:yes stop_codon:yes gene_type:complete
MSFDEEFIKAVSSDLKDNVGTLLMNNEELIPKNAKEWLPKAIEKLKPDYLKKNECNDPVCWEDIKDLYQSSIISTKPEPFKNIKNTKNKEVNLELLLFIIISIIVFFTTLKHISNK